MTATILAAITLATLYPVKAGPAFVACHVSSLYTYNWQTGQYDYTEGHKSRCRIYARHDRRRGLQR